MRIADLATSIDATDYPLILPEPAKSVRPIHVRSQLRQFVWTQGPLGRHVHQVRCTDAQRFLVNENEMAVANNTIHVTDHGVCHVVRKENLNQLAFENKVLTQAARQQLTRDRGYDEVHKLTLVMHAMWSWGNQELFSRIQVHKAREWTRTAARRYQERQLSRSRGGGYTDNL
ncbi:Aste57867_1530 [Aphanomyces stellatus]|uniref:Aste57867_1530 protein n=1 Tax=Aphanomyces stellatus TaxID=120398 RepID=A0A485K824_9STRA|nr:hypothetical protein As57867_001529 [Aphanomyces stellatus]VFT78745.1 Aste57867_1530 [Aphanomyces stellatus]